MVSRLCDDGVQGRDGRCVENSSCFQICLFVPVCILLLGSPAGLIRKLVHLWFLHLCKMFFVMYFLHISASSVIFSSKERSLPFSSFYLFFLCLSISSLSFFFFFRFSFSSRTSPQADLENGTHNTSSRLLNLKVETSSQRKKRKTKRSTVNA